MIPAGWKIERAGDGGIMVIPPRGDIAYCRVYERAAVAGYALLYALCDALLREDAQPAQRVRQVGCERPDGTLNIRAESETCEVCAQPAQSADAPLTSEQRFAVLEANCVAASDAYFSPRPQIDTLDRRKVFAAGFERGWDAARRETP